MEVEFKYRLNDAFTKERIFSDEYIQEIAEGDERIIDMHAIYFDTKDFDLQEKKYAFRARYEGEEIVLTIKWKGESDGALHRRGELNYNIDEEFIVKPNIDVIKDSEIYEEVKEILGEKKLYPIVDMYFLRRELTLNSGKSVCVLSFDEGEIKAMDKKEKISELEVELSSGSEEDMLNLGKMLEKKYSLEALETSKLQRAFELLKK